MDSQNFFEIISRTDEGKKYLDLIDKSRSNSNNLRYEKGFERHHIHPKSLGGTDDASNIVKLTVFDHIIAHIYLAKAFPCYDTVAATCIMCGRQINSLSEVQKITVKEAMEQANIRQLRRKYRKPKTEEENRHFVEQSKKTRIEKYGSLMKQALSSEVIQKRLETVANRYGGDSAGQMHTPKSQLTRKIRMVSKYGGCTKHMQSPEIIEKARQTRKKNAELSHRILETPKFQEWFNSQELKSAFRSVPKFLKFQGQTREEYLNTNT